SQATAPRRIGGGGAGGHGSRRRAASLRPFRSPAIRRGATRARGAVALRGPAPLASADGASAAGDPALRNHLALELQGNGYRSRLRSRRGAAPGTRNRLL